MSMAADLISYVPQPNTSLAVSFLSSFLELLNNQSVFQNVRTEVRSYCNSCIHRYSSRILHGVATKLRLFHA
jgi:hypothetical protein